MRIEESKETSYSTWKKYDIVVWSCGEDYTPINNLKSMQKLTDYVADYCGMEQRIWMGNAH